VDPVPVEGRLRSMMGVPMVAGNVD
jgi:hypothetical protein